jgi:hypothetical protein
MGRLAEILRKKKPLPTNFTKPVAPETQTGNERTNSINRGRPPPTPRIPPPPIPRIPPPRIITNTAFTEALSNYKKPEHIPQNIQMRRHIMPARPRKKEEEKVLITDKPLKLVEK